jgi:hypothetical protein
MCHFRANEFGDIPEVAAVAEEGVVFPEGLAPGAIIRFDGRAIGRITSITMGKTKYVGDIVEMSSGGFSFDRYESTEYPVNGSIRLTQRAYDDESLTGTEGYNGA